MIQFAPLLVWRVLEILRIRECTISPCSDHQAKSGLTSRNRGEVIHVDLFNPIINLLLISPWYVFQIILCPSLRQVHIFLLLPFATTSIRFFLRFFLHYYMFSRWTLSLRPDYLSPKHSRKESENLINRILLSCVSFPTLYRFLPQRVITRLQILQIGREGCLMLSNRREIGEEPR